MSYARVHRETLVLRSYVSKERVPNRAMGFLSNIWWSSHLKWEASITSCCTSLLRTKSWFSQQMSPVFVNFKRKNSTVVWIIFSIIRVCSIWNRNINNLMKSFACTHLSFVEKFTQRHRTCYFWLHNYRSQARLFREALNQWVDYHTKRLQKKMYNAKYCAA